MYKTIMGMTALLIGCALGSIPSEAADAPASPAVERARQQIKERIRVIQTDPAAREQAISNGREHASICGYCHGPDGNSSKPDIPSLAGQNPVYLLEQLERFASGARHDFTTVMPQLARTLSTEDRIALVLYYASVTLKPADGDPVLARQGGILYHQRCTQCHGLNGNGGGEYARLAGQQPNYIRKTLLDFRAQKDTRVSPAMALMTKDLEDGHIDALAAYIASMREIVAK
jgi:cytochrome c553